MSATNHTTNYNLPQFVGTDKPTWLTDVNGAFATIDTTVKGVSDTASGASSTATTTATNLGNIASLETTDKTSAVNAINELNTNLGTVSGVASSASGTATEAINTANAIATALNFTNFKQYADNEINITGGTLERNDGFSVASNADGSIIKIYGQIKVRVTNSGGATITVASSARPTSNIAITGACVGFRYNSSNAFSGSIPKTINIATNGDISFSLSSSYYNEHFEATFVACLLFMKDFGDTPNNA